MNVDNYRELTESYKNSVFNLGIVPEYNIGEVSLASLYRQIGWSFTFEGKQNRYSESKVNDEALRLFREIDQGIHGSDYIFSADDFKSMVYGALSTPKMPNQVKSKHPVLYPLIPDCALYSSAARMKGNPWNPGQLIEKVIVFGAKNISACDSIWRQLFEALSCDHHDVNEDILARALSANFEKYRTNGVQWSLNPISEKFIKFDDFVKYNSPASQFFNDLEKIIQLKKRLTRRQWLSILESSLRISCAAHILWVCNLNIIVWNYFKDCLQNRSIGREQLILNLQNDALRLWKIEEKAVPIIKEQIQGFIRAQIGINYLIKKYDSEGAFTSSILNSIDNIIDFGQRIKERIETGVWGNDILPKINLLFEEDPKLISCKSGSTNSLYEFIRYSMGQKQTAEPHKRNYDQAYWLRKKGNYSSSPWIFDLGPASIMTMAYCCSFGYDQYRTVSDLLRHLNKYGIIISQKDFENSTLLKTLETLQIVSDSPDAEGGMVIKNPFDKAK